MEVRWNLNISKYTAIENYWIEIIKVGPQNGRNVNFFRSFKRKIKEILNTGKSFGTQTKFSNRINDHFNTVQKICESTFHVLEYNWIWNLTYIRKKIELLWKPQEFVASLTASNIMTYIEEQLYFLDWIIPDEMF